MIEINLKFKPWGQIKSNNLKTPMRAARLYKSEHDVEHRIDHGTIVKDPFNKGEYRFLSDNWVHSRHIDLTDDIMIATYSLVDIKASVEDVEDGMFKTIDSLPLSDEDKDVFCKQFISDLHMYGEERAAKRLQSKIEKNLN